MGFAQMRLRLVDSLALAYECLRSLPVSLAAADDDPLQLPPLLTRGPDPTISTQALRTIAAMFLQAELEQAAIISVVELLAEARFRLNITSSTTMKELEDFSVGARNSYDRSQRELIFARLFGTGRGAASERSSTNNNGFQQVFAAFCNALVNHAASRSWGRPPGPGAESPLKHAAVLVVLNLAPRQFGNTLIAGRVIGDQLRRAVDLLNDRGIQTYFQSRGMWDTLRKILGEQTPDVGRLVTRGQAGLHLLNWLAVSLDKLIDSRATSALVVPNDPVFVWAAQWLQATGLAATDAHTGRRVA